MINRRKLFGFLAVTPALPLAAIAAEEKDEFTSISICIPSVEADHNTVYNYTSGPQRRMMVRPDGSLYLEKAK